MTTDQFDTLRLDALTSSTTNPRKTFNATKLAELAASITASGVHQPILVRPLPGSRLADTFDIAAAGGSLKARPTHEIVAGERRYRASKLAGVATIPALIRNLTDAQVFEIQIIENLQRDDLTDLEAAEGYAALMAHNQLTAEEVGQKIGKSRTFVYNCLKLLDLHVDAKEALRRGSIDASRALLIARIPDSKLQLKALTYALAPVSLGNLPSVRDLQAWVRSNVMLPLDKAPFPITVTTLVPDAGSCTDCQKRTGANPDLFADVDSADICIDPPCYQLKSETHHSQQIAAAEKLGFRFVDGKEAKEIVSQYSSELKGYTRLNQVRNDAVGSEGMQLAELLGKDAPAPVLIEHPWSKVLIKAVPTEEAEALLLARGLVKEMEPSSDAMAHNLQINIDRIKRDVDERTARAARTACFEQLRDHIRSLPEHLADQLLSADLLRAHLLKVEHDLDLEECEAVFGLPKAVDDASVDDYVEKIHLRIQNSDDAAIYKMAAIYLLIGDSSSQHNGPTTLLDAFAADQCINLTATRKEAAEDIEAETKTKLADLRKQLKAAKTPPAETTSTPTPAGAAIEGGPAKAKTNTPAALTQKPSPLRKLKLSAQDAKAGIAAAMQGLGSESLDATLGDSERSASENGGGAWQAGQRVQITKNEGLLTPPKRKHAGKIGVIQKAISDNRWLVALENAVGEFSIELQTKHLEAVAA